MATTDHSPRALCPTWCGRSDRVAMAGLDRPPQPPLALGDPRSERECHESGRTRARGEDRPGALMIVMVRSMVRVRVLPRHRRVRQLALACVLSAACSGGPTPAP